jgi:hypothetical protein
MDNDKKEGPNNTVSSHSNTSNSNSTKETEGKHKLFQDGANAEDETSKAK